MKNKLVYILLLSALSVSAFALSNNDKEALKKVLWDKYYIDLWDFSCENGQVQKITTFVNFKDGTYTHSSCEFKDNSMRLYGNTKFTSLREQTSIEPGFKQHYSTRQVSGSIECKNADNGRQLTIALFRKLTPSHVFPYETIISDIDPASMATLVVIDFQKTNNSFQKSLTDNLENLLASNQEAVDNILIPLQSGESPEDYINRLFSSGLQSYCQRAFQKMLRMLNE